MVVDKYDTPCAVGEVKSLLGAAATFSKGLLIYFIFGSKQASLWQGGGTIDHMTEYP